MIDCSMPIPDITDNFFEALDSEHAKAVTCGKEFTLIFVKLGGDNGLATQEEESAQRIMRDIYRIVCLNIRHGDQAFCYGNDGLMIILPLTPGGHAQTLIEKLGPLIRNYAHADGQGARHVITPRFGVSSYPPAR